MAQLSWNRDEDGVITIYAQSSDGRLAEVADFWVKPLVERFGMRRSDALEWQQQFAELLVSSHNRIFTKADNGGVFDTPAPMTAAAVHTPKNSVEFGWGAPPMKDQHPVLSEEVADHFDKDNAAIIRLSLRGLITDSQKAAAFKKLTAKIGKAIRAAISKATVQS